VGQKVELYGLSKDTFNGLTGKIQGFIKEKGRYSVVLDDPDQNGRIVKIKTENLRKFDPNNRVKRKPQPAKKPEPARRPESGRPGGGMGMPRGMGMPGGDMMGAGLRRMGEMSDSNLNKMKGLLNDFVFACGEDNFPKKSFKILNKIAKDNMRGDAKPLKEDNDTMKEAIFAHAKVKEFMRLVGFQPGADGWTIPNVSQRNLNDMYIAINDVFQEAVKRDQERADQEEYDELAFEVKTLTPMSGTYDDMGDIKDCKPVFKSRKRRIKALRIDGVWQFEGRQGIMREETKGDKEANMPLSGRPWILTTRDGIKKRFPKVIINRVESFLMGVKASAADPLRAAQAATSLNQDDVLGLWDRRERSWNQQVVLIESVYNKKLNMGSGFLIQDVSKAASFVEQDCRWVATAAHCVSFFNDGIKQYEKYRVRVLRKFFRSKAKIKEQGFGPQEAMKSKRFHDYMVEPTDIFVYSPYEKHATPYWGTDFALVRLPQYHTLRLLMPLMKWDVKQPHPLGESTNHKFGQKPRYHEVVGFPANTATEQTYIQYSSSKLVRKCPKRDRHKAMHALGEYETDFGFHHFYTQDDKHFLGRYMSQTSAGMSGGAIVCNEKIVGVHVLGGHSEIHGASMMSPKIWNWIKKMQKLHKSDQELESIHQAARLGDLDKVKEFLEAGVKVDETDSNGMHALHYACSMGEEAIVNHLLEANADPKQPLDRKIVLLEAGREQKLIMIKQLTPLHCASYVGHVKICKLLMSLGADIHAKTSWGETPLHMCARGIPTNVKKSPNVKCATVLLEAGAAIGTVDGLGYTPLMHAIVQSQTAMVQLLLQNGANAAALKKGTISCLNLAAQAGSTEIFEMILAQDGVEIDDCLENGPTALMTAVKNAQDPIVALCLQKGASTAYPIDDVLPLAKAIELENYVIADAIIEAGTSINSTSLDESKMPMLFYITSKKGIEYFGDRKAHLNATDSEGNTLCHILVQQQNETAAYFLEEVDIDLNIVNNDGLTAIQLAITLGFGQMFYVFVLIGAKEDDVHKEYGNYMHMAARFNCIGVVENCQTENRSKVNEKFQGKTALHIAAEYGSVGVIKDLVENFEKDIDLSIEDGEGMTALQIAEAHEDKDIKEEMIPLLKKA